MTSSDLRRFGFVFSIPCFAVMSSLFAADSVPLRTGPHRDVTITPLPEGVSEISASGPVPHFWTAPVDAAFDPDKHTVISFEYFSPSGMESVHLRYRQSDGSMTYAGESAMPVAETWQPFAIDFSDVKPPAPKGDPQFRFHLAFAYKPGSSLRIRNFAVRGPNAAELAAKAGREEVRRQREADAAAILSHLRAGHPARIDRVTVGAETVRVAGHAADGASLREIAIHEPAHRGAGLAPAKEGVAGNFSIDLPRFVEGRDRALSRWRLDDVEGNTLSPARWFDTTDPGVAADLPKLSAPHQKGLGGIPPVPQPDHVLFELGIRHATINLVLSPMISETPRPGFTPFMVDGREWFANDPFLKGLETTVRHLNAKEVLVSGILLVPNHAGKPMTHPEAEPRGIYSMPDLTDAEGSAHYRAVIHLLAERFTRPDCRIINWILHNEIDQAGVWTNMGDQPLARYLESYLRSMRIVHQTMRLRDPHARTFISLTHHWTKPSIGSGAYTVRPLLDLFAEMASAGGDFEWGVAYHPYPQDLRNPDTWNDKDVTDDFETPYITPKNLGVLPAYLAQPRFLYLGKTPRAILFSEQGFNTPTLSGEDQRRQVAGLIYTFRKLPSLPTVEAWHLHRYQDMPDGEGGLRLGILDEHGTRKLGWHAYAAIGTEREGEFAKIADEVMAAPRESPDRVVKMLKERGASFVLGGILSEIP